MLNHFCKIKIEESHSQTSKPKESLEQYPILRRAHTYAQKALCEGHLQNNDANKYRDHRVTNAFLSDLPKTQIYESKQNKGDN